MAVYSASGSVAHIGRHMMPSGKGWRTYCGAVGFAPTRRQIIDLVEVPIRKRCKRCLANCANDVMGPIDQAKALIAEALADSSSPLET
jgi:hypothetical protein